MRIAIIGAGISGLVTAYLLHRHHDVVVFEANDYIGGHTHTVDVSEDRRTHAIDTGFIVYNEPTYPNFTRLLKQLNVATRATAMSFSVHCDDSGLEYSGTSLNTLFAQRSNLLRPRFYRMLRDIVRFNRESLAYAGNEAGYLTLGEFLNIRRYSAQFADYYLIPMGAAIWSAPPEEMLAFPLPFFVRFFDNHGLLSINNRPEWRVIEGGSRNYVTALSAGFGQHIRLATPVLAVQRDYPRQGQVCVQSGRDSEELFDSVVFACHADQALALLRDPEAREQVILGCFKYQENEAVLHTDAKLLPRRRLAHACWNYHAPGSGARPATVTYLMNELQGIQSETSYCVTLNKTEAIDPDKIIGRFRYSHPLYTVESHRAQQKRDHISGVNRTYFCGAYWGNGFHEDGVNSALDVCRQFGVGLS